MTTGCVSLFQEPAIATPRRRPTLQPAPLLTLTAMRDDDRAAIAELAIRQHGDRAGAMIAHWLDEDRAVFDVLRDRDGTVQGYLCSVVLKPAADLGSDRPGLADD